MKAPKRRSTDPYNPHWDPPDKEWLEHQYLILEKAVGALRKEVGAHWDTIQGWLVQAGIPLRTLEETYAIQARKVTGSGNPRWDGGYSEGYVHKLARRALEDKRIPEECSWCGQLPLEGKRGGGLEVHHKDHDRWHNEFRNLCYLCVPCHNLEKGLWHLLKQDKIDLVCEGNQMLITFRR